jgi:hypothetical protein
MNERARHFRKNMACTSIHKCPKPNDSYEGLNLIVLPQTPQLKVSLIHDPYTNVRRFARVCIPSCGTRRHPGRTSSFSLIDWLHSWSRRLWNYFHIETRSSRPQRKRKVLEKNSTSRYVRRDHYGSLTLIRFASISVAFLSSDRTLLGFSRKT